MSKTGIPAPERRNDPAFTVDRRGDPTVASGNRRPATRGGEDHIFGTEGNSGPRQLPTRGSHDRAIVTGGVVVHAYDGAIAEGPGLPGGRLSCWACSPSGFAR